MRPSPGPVCMAPLTWLFGPLVPDFSSQVNSPEDQLRLRFRPTEPGQHQRRHCQGRKATEELPLAGLCAQVDLCPVLLPLHPAA